MNFLKKYLFEESPFPKYSMKGRQEEDRTMIEHGKTILVHGEMERPNYWFFLQVQKKDCFGDVTTDRTIDHSGEGAFEQFQDAMFDLLINASPEQVADITMFLSPMKKDAPNPVVKRECATCAGVGDTMTGTPCGTCYGHDKWREGR